MRFCKILLFLFFVIVQTSLSAQNQSSGRKSNSPATLQKLSTIYYLIDNFYVDTANMEQLTEEAIVAILKELDPHSAYISKKDVEKANEPLVGSFEGIGVTFQIFQDTILVISPVSGGPSDKVGIMAGDKIVTIDGEEAVGKKVTNEYVAEHLRGKSFLLSKPFSDQIIPSLFSSLPTPALLFPKKGKSFPVKNIQTLSFSSFLLNIFVFFLIHDSAFPLLQ